MRPTRVLLGSVGVLAGAYGAWRLLELGVDNLLAVSLWLAGGVLVHDFLLAPLIIAVCLIGTLLLPRRLHAAAAYVLLVFGTVTLTAVPVLGRFGAEVDNQTLLDRPYWTGWLAFASLVVVVSLVTAWRSRARTEN